MVYMLFPPILSHKMSYSTCLVWLCIIMQEENTGHKYVGSFSVYFWVQNSFQMISVVHCWVLPVGALTVAITQSMSYAIIVIIFALDSCWQHFFRWVYIGCYHCMGCVFSSGPWLFDSDDPFQSCPFLPQTFQQLLYDHLSVCVFWLLVSWCGNHVVVTVISAVFQNPENVGYWNVSS